MDEAAEHHSAQPGWQSVLLGCRRSVYRVAFRLLWSTTDLGALHVNGFGYVGLVRGCDKLQLLSGGAHLEWILLHRRASGKHYSGSAYSDIR